VNFIAGIKNNRYKSALKRHNFNNNGCTPESVQPLLLEKTTFAPASPVEPAGCNGFDPVTNNASLCN
jgi:hypothetical protein